MKRKITLLEKRFDSKVKENKEKEQFIKDYIIGNNGNPNDSQYLVKELESIFLEKEKIDSLTHWPIDILISSFLLIFFIWILNI